MSETTVNTGDMRVTVDFDYLESVSNKSFADAVKGLIRKLRPCTFYKLSIEDRVVTVHMAIGFYMQNHNLTAHTDVFYLQFHKEDGTLYQCEFGTHFLKTFSSIGITVID